MDREKAEVYELMANVIAKMVLVGVCSVVFLVVTGFLLYNPNWYLATFNAVCSVTVGRVILHYFPAKSSAKKAPKRIRNG